MLESSDDDSQRVGRLKQVAACLALADWTDLLPADRHVSINTVSEDQRGGVSNGILFGAADGLQQRMQELEKLVSRFTEPSDQKTA